MTIDINTLRTRYNRAEKEYAIAVDRKEQAQRALKATIEEMQREYMVASLDEAKEKLAEYQEELTALTDKMDTLLTEAGF